MEGDYYNLMCKNPSLFIINDQIYGVMRELLKEELFVTYFLLSDI